MLAVLAPICRSSRNSFALATTVASTVSVVSVLYVGRLRTEAGFNLRLSASSGEPLAVLWAGRKAKFRLMLVCTEPELVAWLSTAGFMIGI
jgi:hypothetical protein